MNSKYISVDGLDDSIVISYYEKLKAKLKSVVYYLRKSVSSLDLFDGDLSDYYTIDGSNVGNVNIETVKEELNGRIRKIENVIIPAITNEINSIKNKTTGI